MISRFYRWLYHFRQQRAAQNRLHGKRRVPRSFKRFKHNVFDRERFGKYDPPKLRLRWTRWLIGTPLLLGALWFIWESAHVIGTFQP